MTTTISTSVIKDKIDQTHVSEPFKCAWCNDVFDSEKLSDEHIEKCHTMNINSLLKSRKDDFVDETPKQKIFKPLSTNEITHSIDKNNDQLIDEFNNIKPEEHVYSTTSKMLSANEMLITLPYDGSSKESTELGHSSFLEGLDYPNKEVNESDTFEIEYRQHTYNESTESLNFNNKNVEVIVENIHLEMPDGIAGDSSVKVLTVLSSNKSYREKPNNVVKMTNNSIIIEKVNLNGTENSSKIKTLTVLNPFKRVDIISNHSNVVDISISGLISDSMESEKEVNYVEYHNPESSKIKVDKHDDHKAELKMSRLLKSTQSKGSLTKKKKGKNYQKIWDSKVCPSTNKIKPAKNCKRKPRKTNTRDNSSKRIVIDLDNLKTPLNKKLKQIPVIQTYAHRNNIQIKSDQKLYQKIPLPNPQDEVEESNNLSVFDFYDEEDEKRKIENEKRENELQAIKERTCMYCKEIFNDPMDVLRHKRKAHRPRKILLSLKELEPYLKLENRTDCPLCFKEICASGYRSWYIKHVMSHCENSSYTCEVCGMKFKRKDHGQAHEKRHLMPPY